MEIGVPTNNGGNLVERQRRVWAAFQAVFRYIYFLSKNAFPHKFVLCSLKKEAELLFYSSMLP